MAKASQMPVSTNEGEETVCGHVARRPHNCMTKQEGSPAMIKQEGSPAMTKQEGSPVMCSHWTRL